jgi:hypothetical protein
MGLVRYTACGLPVPFLKSDKKQCINCQYSSEKLFRKTYKCRIILGLSLDKGDYGYCSMYEKRT